jgi:hypothetical protein
MRTQQHLAAKLLAGSVLVCGGLAHNAHGQATWSRTYGGAVSEQGLKDLALLPGGRLVVAGYTASFGGPTQASWLMNLDLTTGEVGTEQVSTSAFGGFTDGATIAADGGALFLGRDVLNIFNKHDAWLMRADPSGQVAWSLGFTRPGTGRHFLFDAAELDDGSWIAVGATSIIDMPPQAAWIVRVSSTGTLLWQYEYGGGIDETASSVKPTSDGGFVVTGWTNSSGAGFDDVWVMKIDSAGVIQWQKTFGGKDYEQAEEIIELDDGGFAVAGFTRSLTSSEYAPWILRLDAAGALLWHKAVSSNVWGNVEGIAQTGDGELIVVGRVAETGFPTNDLWSAKLASADGSVLWQRAYEGATGDYGSIVVPLGCNNGYVLGGTWGWGFAGESIWLQRTDSAGELAGCGIERSTSFSMISPKITEQNGTTIRAPGGAQVESPGVKVGPSSAVVTEICSPSIAVLEVPRGGVPPNPAALLPGVTSGPIIGSTWDPVIDHTTFVSDSILDILGLAFAPMNIPLPGLGTLLCDPSGLIIQFVAPAPGLPFSVSFPDDCSLVGYSLCSQGVSLNGVVISLTNALDITIGTF